MTVGTNRNKVFHRIDGVRASKLGYRHGMVDVDEVAAEKSVGRLEIETTGGAPRAMN
jgi:hypothetical protein